ncbi:MAG: antitoxin [Brevibacterium aurantiacum]
MGLDDLTNKAKDAVNSEKGEEFSDQGLDKATDFANDKTGGKLEAHKNLGREGVDVNFGIFLILIPSPRPECKSAVVNLISPRRFFYVLSPVSRWGRSAAGGASCPRSRSRRPRPSCHRRR